MFFRWQLNFLLNKRLGLSGSFGVRWFVNSSGAKEPIIFFNGNASPRDNDDRWQIGSEGEDTLASYSTNALALAVVSWFRRMSWELGIVLLKERIAPRIYSGGGWGRTKVLGQKHRLLMIVRDAAAREWEKRKSKQNKYWFSNWNSGKMHEIR